MFTLTTPNLARTSRHGILFFLLAFLWSVSSFAAGPAHHFEFSKPKSVRVGETCAIRITVHDKEGTWLKEQALNLTIYFSSRHGMIETPLRLKKGEVKVDRKFDAPGVYLIQLIDSQDADLTGSESVDVLPALPPSTSTGVKP